VHPEEEMEWEHFEELGFVMSGDEGDHPEVTVLMKFLDAVPDELINAHIWPRLFVLPPVDDNGKLKRTLTQAEHKDHIQQMCLLRRVCHGWNRWVRGHEDWVYGVCNYIENYLMLEEYLNRNVSSDEEDNYYDSDREPSSWKEEV
jgi:hypothetical protein